MTRLYKYIKEKSNNNVTTFMIIYTTTWYIFVAVASELGIWTFFSAAFYPLAPIFTRVTFTVLGILGQFLGFTTELNGLMVFEKLPLGIYVRVPGIDIYTASGQLIQRGYLSYRCLGAGILLGSYGLVAISAMNQFLSNKNRESIDRSRIAFELVLNTFLLTTIYVFYVVIRYTGILLLYWYFFGLGFGKEERIHLGHDLYGNAFLPLLYGSISVMLIWKITPFIYQRIIRINIDK